VSTDLFYKKCLCFVFGYVSIHTWTAQCRTEVKKEGHMKTIKSIVVVVFWMTMPFVLGFGYAYLLWN